MSNICNKLQLLVPPPFLTLKTDNVRLITSKWSSRIPNHYSTTTHTHLLQIEFHYLAGYVERKGSQLRLEKALLLTTQIIKLSLRWRRNEFTSQLIHFGNGMGPRRVPTLQWGSWILYLVLREAAILAKIKLECERTTGYWLGLISEAHHWGDSLVVTGILARIWHLTSLMIDDLITGQYPSLCSIQSLLPKSQSAWPDLKLPPDLLIWLNWTMKLNYHPANMSRSLNIMADGQSDQLLSAILSTFQKPGLEEPSYYIDTTPGDLEFGAPAPEEEDLGILVKPPGWKEFRQYWKKLLVNYEEKIKSGSGRRILIKRLKKYKMKHNVEKNVRARLIRLIREVRACEEEDQVYLKEFNKFQIFIQKQIGILKRRK